MARQYSIEYARNLRRNQTDAEQILWRYLRNRHFHGYKFRRQHPIGPYIVDFYCESMKLVVELDGSQHMQATHYDQRRTEYLNQGDCKVVRFWNNDVLARLDAVLESLSLTLSRREREIQSRGPLCP